MYVFVGSNGRSCAAGEATHAIAVGGEFGGDGAVSGTDPDGFVGQTEIVGVGLFAGA